MVWIVTSGMILRNDMDKLRIQTFECLRFVTIWTILTDSVVSVKDPAFLRFVIRAHDVTNNKIPIIPIVTCYTTGTRGAYS